MREEKLTYEELGTTLPQIEVCLNSMALTPLPETMDTLELLSPGHFLIVKPLMALLTCPRGINLLRYSNNFTIAKN